MKAVTARSRPLDRLPTRDDARAIGERTKRAVRRPRTASDSRRRASYAGRRRAVELRPHTRRATPVRPPLRAHRTLTQGSDSRDRSTCGSPRSVAPKRAASPYLHVRSGHLMTVSTRIGVPMSAPAAPIAEITGMKERAPLALDRPAASAFTRNRRLFGSCRWHFVSIRKSSPPSLTRASTSSAAPSHRRASSVTVAPRAHARGAWRSEALRRRPGDRRRCSCPRRDLAGERGARRSRLGAARRAQQLRSRESRLPGPSSVCRRRRAALRLPPVGSSLGVYLTTWPR